MFPVEGPACGCHCSHAVVGQNEYQGAGGCNRVVSVSDKGALEPLGALGKGGVRGLAAVWPGVSGLMGGWARLTRSSPDESDSLSDSGIWRSLNGAGFDCVNFNSFTGN